MFHLLICQHPTQPSVTMSRHVICKLMAIQIICNELFFSLLRFCFLNLFLLFFKLLINANWFRISTIDNCHRCQDTLQTNFIHVIRNKFRETFAAAFVFFSSEERNDSLCQALLHFSSITWNWCCWTNQPEWMSRKWDPFYELRLHFM